MELRRTIISAILLAIGFVVHQLVPPFFGVTFDIELAMLFTIIALYMDLKNVIVVSMASGIITAITTKFPGGQIPNMIDKMITGIIVYLLLLLLQKVLKKQTAMFVVGFVGTVISGSVFLFSAKVLAGLPASFTFLFLTVVLPTAAANTAIAPLLYGLVTASKRAVKLDF